MSEENDTVNNGVDSNLDVEKIEKSVQDLCRSNFSRNVAVKYLSGVGKAAIPYVMKALDSNIHRGGAIETLVNMGETGVEPLIACLDAKNAQTRAYAARALGDMGKPLATVAVPRLIEMLDDWYEYARLNCVYALGILGDKDTGVIVRDRLKVEKDYRVHNEIVTALERLGLI